MRKIALQFMSEDGVLRPGPSYLVDYSDHNGREGWWVWRTDRAIALRGGPFATENAAVAWIQAGLNEDD